MILTTALNERNFKNLKMNNPNFHLHQIFNLKNIRNHCLSIDFNSNFYY